MCLMKCILEILKKKEKKKERKKDGPIYVEQIGRMYV